MTGLHEERPDIADLHHVFVSRAAGAVTLLGSTKLSLVPPVAGDYLWQTSEHTRGAFGVVCEDYLWCGRRARWQRTEASASSQSSRA